MRQPVKPAFRHVALGARAAGGLEPRRRVGRNVERRVREGAVAGEADQVQVDEREVEAGWLGDEDRFTDQPHEPRDVLQHCLLRRERVPAAGFPGLGSSLPPLHRPRVSGGAGQQFEAGREGAHRRLIRQVCGRAQTEHRVRAGDGAVGLDVRAE